MIKKIQQYIFAGGMFLGIASCTKEKAVDDFIVFARLKISNATTYNSLHAEVDSVSMQIHSNSYYKLKPGKNHIAISGKGGSPQDTAVAIFDTVMHVEANKQYEFVLFQPSPENRPTVVVNDQQNEADPAEGFVKIRIANYALKCFPDAMDLELVMFDHNFETIPTDTIELVGTDFQHFNTFRLLDKHIAASGFVGFRPLHPITKEPLGELFSGLELDNHQARSWYKVVTLYVTEELSEFGDLVGSDGNKYIAQVKTLFIK